MTTFDLVRKHFPQFAEPALQREIGEVGKLMHFKAGEVIMNYGSYVKLVPLVIKGSIKVMREDDHDGKELLLYLLDAGDTCSMSFSCCMMNKKSEIRTEAEEDTTLIGIPVNYVDEWMGKYQSWKNFVMRSYDQRMQELVRVIHNISFHGFDKRLLQYLRDLSATRNSPTIQRTHQEIADDLNVSREAVSRLMKKLEKQGIVQLSRNQFTLLK
ncbi:MAG: Crp/Fnr family transcriptional regulator [Saprospiraceae bacterium]